MKRLKSFKNLRRLKRTFFNRDTLIVAKELLGKVLVFNNFQGIITETEAYRGFDDPASHAYRGITKRTELMFGPAGFSYVYLIYGMYYCLNFVTEKKDFPAAVLIRGLLLENVNNEEGLENGHGNGHGQENGQGKTIHLNGPGKICKYLGITKEHNGIDIANSRNKLDFYVGCIKKELDFQCTPRIGISKGLDKLWRFVAEPTTHCP